MIVSNAQQRRIDDYFSTARKDNDDDAVVKDDDDNHATLDIAAVVATTTTTTQADLQLICEIERNINAVAKKRGRPAAVGGRVFEQQVRKFYAALRASSAPGSCRG